MLEALTTSFSIGGEGFKILKSIEDTYARLRNSFPKIERSNTSMWDKMQSRANRFLGSIKNGTVRIGNAFKIMAARSNIPVDSMWNRMRRGGTKFFNSIKRGTAGAINAFNRMKASSRGLYGKLGGKNGGFGVTGRVAGLVTGVGLTFGLAGAINEYKSFDDVMLKTKAISGATGESYDKLRNQAKLLGAQTRFTATQVGEAQKYQAMAGWKVNQIMNATPAIMNLATASGEQLGTVSDIVTDSMTAFSWSANQASKFTDILAQAATQTNTSVGLLGESFKYVSPTAATLGESVQSTATWLGILANNGIKGSMAGVSLNETMQSLIKPSKEASALLGQLGVKAKDANGNFLGLDRIFPQIRKGLKGLGNADKGAILNTIFGERGGRAANLILNTTQEQIRKLKRTIEDSAGATSKMSKIMDSGLGGALARAKSAVSGFGIELIETFSIDISSGLDSFSNWLNESLPKIKVFITELRDFWKANKDFIIAISAGVVALNILMGVLALASAPFSALALGIAAVIAGIVLMYRKFEWFRKIVHFVKDLIVAYVKEILWWFNKVVSMWKSVGNFIGRFFNFKNHDININKVNRTEMINKSEPSRNQEMQLHPMVSAPLQPINQQTGPRITNANVYNNNITINGNDKEEMRRELDDYFYQKEIQEGDR
nr:phage tail tape measure protein [uncultured Cetobacterium sp.]